MRKITSVCFILIFLTNLGAAPRKSQSEDKTILPAALRQKMIQDLEALLNTPYVNLDNINSPFSFDQELELQREPEDVRPPIKKKKKINELVILAQVGRSLKPSGSIQKNGEMYLCIDGNQVINKDTTLDINYQGKHFLITISDIQKKSFTLKLNNYSLTFNY